mmetsp:Transcript_9590/g.21801  ORF Transcript_9590/g.21801 Transcript_9590/m.21801 type:complete len:247 (-) Transcript_9590:187-927(-)
MSLCLTRLCLSFLARLRLTGACGVPNPHTLTPGSLLPRTESLSLPDEPNTISSNASSPLSSCFAERRLCNICFTGRALPARGLISFAPLFSASLSMSLATTAPSFATGNDLRYFVCFAPLVALSHSPPLTLDASSPALARAEEVERLPDSLASFPKKSLNSLFWFSLRTSSCLSRSHRLLAVWLRRDPSPRLFSCWRCAPFKLVEPSETFQEVRRANEFLSAEANGGRVAPSTTSLRNSLGRPEPM